MCVKEQSKFNAIASRILQRSKLRRDSAYCLNAHYLDCSDMFTIEVVSDSHISIAIVQCIPCEELQARDWQVIE